MRHLVASLLCIALLVLMVAIFGAIVGGTYKDFVAGRPFDPTTVTEMFSDLHYRKVLMALIIALAFATLDIQALYSRTDDPRSYVQPRSVPLGFAALRARRYLLPIVVLSYVGLYFRNADGLRGMENFISNYDIYLFAALFLLARRPLNSTIDEALGHITNGISEFLGGIAKGH